MGSNAEENIDANEIECPNCGETVYAEALTCPKCGLHFYADELSGPAGAETRSPEREISLSAILAGWLVSAGAAFLINFFASRIWSPQALNSAGRAVVLIAGPLGSLAGGYLSARMSGRRVLLHGFVVSILSLLTASLIETYWYDLFNEPLRLITVAGWALMLLSGPAGAWLWARMVKALEFPAPAHPHEQRLYLDLLARVRHDIDTAERLIDLERRRNPSASRLVWIQYAIERINHDRR